MAIDPTRHLEVFSPQKFGSKRVDIVGAGATGSNVAMQLAKLGVTNLHVWDFDAVESHNIANQIYHNSHIGQAKVDALADMILDATGVEITKHPTALMKGEKDLGEVVFVLTDTMSSRLDIIENCIFMNGVTDIAIETRMGSKSGTIHSFNPKSYQDIQGWKTTHFKDEEATSTSACGATTTVGPTAALIASMAVWQFMRWNETGKIEEKVIDVCIEPSLIVSGTFKAA